VPRKQTELALSIFSGLGGLDLGARIAGLNVQVATDIDGEALRLLSRACGSPHLVADVDEALAGGLSSLWTGEGAPRVLVGGPPCTPFSHAGFWLEDKRLGRDPARHLLQSYLDCLEQFSPDAFVLENVPGLAFKTHRPLLDSLVQRAQDLSYEVTSSVLIASAFGVAQARRRLFIVGTRKGEAASLSEWPLWPRRSARWAIGELGQTGIAEPDEEPGERYRELLPLVPPGGNYLHFTAPRGWSPPLFRYRGRYWSFLLKIDPDEPAPTLPAQRITYNGPFHWLNRHLRKREIARLQSFPDWYPLSEDLSTARRHLGNAVPPLLAAAVITRVRQALGDISRDEWPIPLKVALDPDARFEDVAAAYPDPPRLPWEERPNAPSAASTREVPAIA
jgi:DNA (cytosine-5)-methyltransferase 1